MQTANHNCSCLIGRYTTRKDEEQESSLQIVWNSCWCISHKDLEAVVLYLQAKADIFYATGDHSVLALSRSVMRDKCLWCGLAVFWSVPVVWVRSDSRKHLTLFLHTVHEVEPTGQHLDCCQVRWCLAYLPQACWLHHVAFLLITSPDSTDYVCSSLCYITVQLAWICSQSWGHCTTYLLTYIHVLLAFDPCFFASACIVKYVCVICCLLTSFQFGLSLSNFHRIWPCFVTLNCGSLDDYIGWQTGGSLPALPVCRFRSFSAPVEVVIMNYGSLWQTNPSDDFRDLDLGLDLCWPVLRVVCSEWISFMAICINVCVS